MTKSHISPKAIRSIQILDDYFPNISSGVFKPEDFSHPSAYIELKDGSQRCSVLKVSKRCNQKFNKGYLVTTNEGHIFAIGHCCTKDKLQQEHSQILEQLQSFSKEASLEEDLEAYFSHLSEKDNMLALIESTLFKYRRLKENIFGYLDSVPQVLKTELLRRAKSRNSKIIIETLHYKDETGSLVKPSENEQTEKVWVKRSIGQVDNIYVLNTEILRPIWVELNSIKKLWTALNDTPPERRLNKTISELSNAKGRLEHLDGELATLNLKFEEFQKVETQLLILYVTKHVGAREQFAKQLHSKGAFTNLRLTNRNIVGQLDRDICANFECAGYRVAA